MGTYDNQENRIPPLCLIFDCRVDKLHFAEYSNVLYKADEKVGGLTGPT